MYLGTLSRQLWRQASSWIKLYEQASRLVDRSCTRVAGCCLAGRTPAQLCPARIRQAALLILQRIPALLQPRRRCFGRTWPRDSSAGPASVEILRQDAASRFFGWACSTCRLGEPLPGVASAGRVAHSLGRSLPRQVATRAAPRPELQPRLGAAPEQAALSRASTSTSARLKVWYISICGISTAGPQLSGCGNIDIYPVSR